MIYSKSKYMATVRLNNEETGYKLSDHFDECFAYIQSSVKHTYKEAFITDLDEDRLILVMKEVS